MRSQLKDIHMLYLAMQHNDRNYFVELSCGVVESGLGLGLGKPKAGVNPLTRGV